MLNSNVKEILNEQINKEFYSAYLYFAMSAYFSEIGLYGFANWTKIQAMEEIDHGLIIFDYLLDRNAKITLKQIDCPEVEFNSPKQVFEKILEHEKYVTSLIDSIAVKALDECDLTTKNFINWYISEQVEEEKNTDDILTRLKLFGDNGASLFLLDKELSQREYKKHSVN